MKKLIKEGYQKKKLIKNFKWKKLSLYVFLVLMLFLNSARATCDDKPDDGVDYSNCQFADGQDLNGTYIPNANLSFTGFIKVIFDKSIMMNTNLANGKFSRIFFLSSQLVRGES